MWQNVEPKPLCEDALPPGQQTSQVAATPLRDYLQLLVLSVETGVAQVVSFGL